MSEISDAGQPHRGDQLAQFIVAVPAWQIPEPVLHEAKRALVDYLAVSISAAGANVVRAVSRTARLWQASGQARIILGGTTAPALAALINGTMAHADDYDDTHPAGAGHPSGPCWSAALALAQTLQAGEQATLVAFITGYEIMARLGGGGVPGVGRNLQRRGFHPTSVVGRAGAAAVAASLLGLDAGQAAHALGAAATMMGGLQKSSGTDGKPFHAGKAAMDGILAAQLAAEGFISSRHFYESDGWVKTFIQQGDITVPPLDFGARWELLGNGYKLYASCRGTHASIETAIGLYPLLGGRAIKRVFAKVHPMGLVNSGIPNPRTPLETKFSIQHCIALALCGYSLTHTDFTQQTVDDAAGRALLALVEIEAVEGQPPYTSYIDIELADGTWLHGKTAMFRGHPENPLTDGELRHKFEQLTVPVVGTAISERLYQTAAHFEQPGSLLELTTLLAGRS